MTSPDLPAGEITIAVTISERPCVETSTWCGGPELPATGLDPSAMLGMPLLIAVAVAALGVGARTWASRRSAREGADA